MEIGTAAADALRANPGICERGRGGPSRSLLLSLFPLLHIPSVPLEVGHLAPARGSGGALIQLNMITCPAYACR